MLTAVFGTGGTSAMPALRRQSVDQRQKLAPAIILLSLIEIGQATIGIIIMGSYARDLKGTVRVTCDARRRRRVVAESKKAQRGTGYLILSHQWQTWV